MNQKCELNAVGLVLRFVILQQHLAKPLHLTTLPIQYIVSKEFGNSYSLNLTIHGQTFNNLQ